ncbi:hypothetical protein V8E55_004534 [Tylopilus felleus]
MNSSYTIDETALLVAVRVKAALEVIPSIVGPKDVWMRWMRDNLVAHYQRGLPKPTPSSPHPKLIGSLVAMLYRHYSGGIGLDTLCFEEVRENNPSTMGPEYVDVSVDALPPLEEVDTWWKVLPSNGRSFRDAFKLSSDRSPQHSASESEETNSIVHGAFREGGRVFEPYEHGSALWAEAEVEVEGE